MIYDPTDPESVADEEAWREGRDAFRADAWWLVLQTPHGRAVVAELLLSTGYGGQTYVPGSFDATAFNEGKRSIGIAVREKIALLYSEFLPDIESQLLKLAGDVGRGGTTSD